ncbi:MAG: Na+:solute symporter [Anaerohalosphaeraceae bacterium]|nr:Na+:solute symporter [Anaerohalosphaeraceae bacterium]
MNWLDWTVIGVFCTVIMAIGLSLAKRGGGSMTDFFLAGRKLPWWLAGLSMMATNFASDTPLHQSGNARKGGFVSYWFYLRGIMTSMSIAFIFAKLWRRANVLTDVEFFELRHGKNSARILRITVASYNCFIFAPLKIGLFTLAMSKIAKVVFQMPETFQFMGCSFSSHITMSVGVVVFAMVYSAASGLWGVAVTDFIEWFIAIIGTYALLVLSFKACGGPRAMVDTLQSMGSDGRLPFDFTRLTPMTFLSPVLIMLFLPWRWIADGDLAPVQRLMACKTEKDAMLSQLMRTIMNSILRSLPWIICGLASIIIFAGIRIEDPNDAYAMLIHKLMPHGLLGLMMASFLAAFLSSTDTYLNLGSAYFMNDLYRRFIVKHKDEHHYVKASRYVTIVLAILGILIAVMSDNVFELFKLMLKVMAGVSLVRAFRWLWWRINGWAMLIAIVTATIVPLSLSIWKSAYFEPDGFMSFFTTTARPPAQWLIDTFHIVEPVFPNFLYFTVDVSLITFFVTASWLIGMFLTKPDPTEALKEFYRRVRPAGPGWKPIAKLCPEVKITDSLSADLFACILGCIFCYSAFFGITAMYFLRWKIAVIALIIAVVFGILLKYKVLDRYTRMAEIDRELQAKDC